MIVDTQNRASSLCALFVIFVFMTVIQESEFLIHSLTEERNELHAVDVAKKSRECELDCLSAL